MKSLCLTDFVEEIELYFSLLAPWTEVIGDQDIAGVDRLTLLDINIASRRPRLSLRPLCDNCLIVPFYPGHRHTDTYHFSYTHGQIIKTGFVLTETTWDRAHGRIPNDDEFHMEVSVGRKVIHLISRLRFKEVVLSEISSIENMKTKK